MMQVASQAHPAGTRTLNSILPNQLLTFISTQYYKLKATKLPGKSISVGENPVVHSGPDSKQ